MRDLARRIQRYRLGRYGRAPRFRLRRWPLWLAGGAWLAWAAFLSDHSWLRILKLRGETQRSQRQTAAVEQEIERLEREASDPRLRRESAERWLREQGGMARPGEIVYRIQDGAPDTLAR